MKNLTTAESADPDPAISSGKGWRDVSAIAFANTLKGSRLAPRRIIDTHNSQRHRRVDLEFRRKIFAKLRSFRRRHQGTGFDKRRDELYSPTFAAQIFEKGFICRVDEDNGVGATNSFDATR